MNGQHLRSLPSERLTKLIGERWKKSNILKEAEGSFIDVSFTVPSFPYKSLSEIYTIPFPWFYQSPMYSPHLFVCFIPSLDLYLLCQTGIRRGAIENRLPYWPKKQDKNNK